MYLVIKEKHFIWGTLVNFFLEKGADLPIDKDLKGIDILKPLLFVKNLDRRKILVGLVTDSLNVSATINIDSDPKGIEILKPLLFGKNLDGHT